MKIFLLCIISCAMHTPSRAQLLDSVAASFHSKPKFYMDLSSYNSVVSHQSALFTTLIVGVSFNKKVYLGVGGSWLNSDIVTPQTITDSSGSYLTNTKLKMGLFIISGEYVFLRKYPWTFSVLPVKVGIGNGYYQYISRENKTLTNLKIEPVIIYQPELTASYNVLKWIGFGASVGERFTLHTPLLPHKELNSFTYSIGVKLFLSAIYDAVFPNGVFPKKK